MQEMTKNNISDGNMDINPTPATRGKRDRESKMTFRIYFIFACSTHNN